MYEEYNTRIIDFGDKVEITKYGKTKVRASRDIEIDDNRRKNDTPEAKEKRVLDQSYRIKRKIKHYCLCNNFDLFFTLTFDDSKVNAKDYQYARKQLTSWLKYQREKYGRFGYIFVPELHPTSGRIHFHGVTTGFSPPLVKARSKKTNRLIKKKGLQIYNAENWKKGFSTVSKIQDSAKAGNYLTKYLTKELMEIPTAYNQAKYFVSQGLNKPDISYDTQSDDEFEQFEPSYVVGELTKDTNEFEANISIYNLEIENGEYVQTSTPETVIKLKESKD